MDTIQIINTIMTTIIVPWLILIERRISRLEGYLKAKVNYNGCG